MMVFNRSICDVQSSTLLQLILVEIASGPPGPSGTAPRLPLPPVAATDTTAIYELAIMLAGRGGITAAGQWRPAGRLASGLTGGVFTADVCMLQKIS